MSDETSLSERIEAVSAAEADGEQLVSVAVQPDDSLEATRQRIEADHAEAEYLDVREEMRQPLKRAIEEAKRVLHQYDETPANGLAVYVGVVGGDFVTYVFDELPDPVASSTYGYANEFDTDPIAPSVPGTDTYGLLVVTREEAVLGRYDGTNIATVETVSTDVPSKQAAEERNEDRFQGRSEERRKEFFEEIGDAVERAFLAGPLELEEPEEGGREPTVSGLLLGGSEVVVERFRNDDPLPDPLADSLAGPFDVEYASEPGLRQLVDAAEAAGDLDETDARDSLDRFLHALDEGDPAVGGREDVERALEYDAVDTLLLLDSLPPEDAQELEERALESGADTVVVPEDIERADQLRVAFDGLGALLRYPIK